MKRIVKSKTVIQLWGPPVVWAVIIFLLSARPVIPASQIFWKDFLLKKSAHIIEYAIFTVLIYRALKESGVKKYNAGLVAILISVIYGATDEYHQSFTPGREPRVRDVFFDTIGAILVVYYIWNLLPKAPKRLKAWAEKLRLT
ncbi:VanZ family protein [Candidatus Woesebacteria bacterium]|nr:VanZ family protein [Candidatus Woesebacteria bacterium]